MTIAANFREINAAGRQQAMAFYWLEVENIPMLWLFTGQK
jgi:hypothetical protein